MKRFGRPIRWSFGIVVALGILVVGTVIGLKSDEKRYGKGYNECISDGDAGIAGCTKYLSSGNGDSEARASAIAWRGYLNQYYKKDFDSAISDYQQAHTLNPDKVLYVQDIAYALSDKGDCDAAIKALKTLIDRD